MTDHDYSQTPTNLGTIAREHGFRAALGFLIVDGSPRRSVVHVDDLGVLQNPDRGQYRYAPDLDQVSQQVVGAARGAVLDAYLLGLYRAAEALTGDYEGHAPDLCVRAYTEATGRS